MATRFRAFAADDKRLVQFKVSKSNMEALAMANYRTYFHPITLSIWVAFAAAFIRVMNWWPTGEYGMFGYLRSLPAFAATAVPILLFVDWFNRQDIEKLTQEVLQHPDLQDIPRHYRDPASGFWILESDEKYVGLIAVDSTQPRNREEENKKRRKTAVIRHFHVEEQYRRTNIQDDLLKFAIDRAFESDPQLERLQAKDSPLVSYVCDALSTHGFGVCHPTKQVGLLRWKLGVRYLERENWSQSQKT